MTMNNDQEDTILTEYVDFLEDHLSRQLHDDAGNSVVGNEAAMIFALRRSCMPQDIDNDD